MQHPLVEKIIKKPTALVIIPLIYFILVILLKWRLSFTPEILLYFIGSVLGIYLLDIAEYFFNVHPSPFRSILFCLGLFVVSIYTITSTRELIAIGLVLSLSLTILLYQVSEWKLQKNLNSWYRIFFDPPSLSIQKTVLIAEIVIVGIETLLFIRL